MTELGHSVIARRITLRCGTSLKAEYLLIGRAILFLIYKVVNKNFAAVVKFGLNMHEGNPERVWAKACGE